ncbi:MAG: PASTA domain-containing protein [Eubacteriales bacterium]
MASFLEQINNKETRPAPLVREKKEDETIVSGSPGSVQAEQASLKKTENPSPRHSPASSEKTPQPTHSTVPHGIPTVEHESVIDRGYFFRKLIAAGISILLLLLLLGAGGFLIHRMRLVEVKDFSGRSIAEMRKWAAEYNLLLDEQAVYDDTATEGIILSQDTTEGEKLSPKSIISVTVSSGADPNQKITVPAFSGMTAAEIREWITKEKLIAAKITEQNSDTVARGSVIRYEFGSVSVSEENFRRNDSLTIYVSKGPARSEPTTPEETVTVPDYSRIQKEDAENVSVDVVVSVKTVYSDTVPYGGFIRQSPNAGEKISKKQNTVTLLYSLGRPFLPELAGKSESELPELFYNLNRCGADLNYRVEYVSGNVPKGQILSGSRNNEFVPIGEQITVYVCRTSLGLVVPDFSKITREDAESAAKNLSVKVKNIYDNTVPYGGFIRQSVVPGVTLTDTEETVTVYYSLGRPYIPDLRGRNEAELPEFFYKLNTDGANITYRLEYITSGATEGTIIYASACNEYISVGATLLIRISK